MRIKALSAAIVLWAAAASQAQQQPVPTGPLPATTVQLPSFSIFSVRTTVSVPDGGGAYLGGVNRGRDGSTMRGLGNRGIGSDRNAGGVMVHAKIHDMDELDKAALAEAAAKRGPEDPNLAKAEQIRRGVGRPADDQPANHDIGPTSVAVIRAKNAAAAEARAKEATDLLAKADAAQAAGKAGIAKIYYQMVSRRATGELKQLADSRLAALDRKPAPDAPLVPVADTASPTADAASVDSLR
jgi:hypothetical protein